MTRNLKALGLALVATLALGATGAPGASADEEHSFRSSVEDTVLTGSSASTHVFTFTGGIYISCTVASLEGTNIGTTRDTLTVHPKYSSCTYSIGGSATIHTNGCNYILDSDTTVSSHSRSTEHAVWSLECEPGHHILITAPGCNYTIGMFHEQTVNQSRHGLRYSQLRNHSGKHALIVNWTVKTVHYTVLGSSLCGLAGHPAGTYTNGIITGSTTLTGYNASGLASGSTTSGYTWTHGAQVDLTISTPE